MLCENQPINSGRHTNRLFFTRDVVTVNLLCEIRNECKRALIFCGCKRKRVTEKKKSKDISYDELSFISTTSIVINFSCPLAACTLFVCSFICKFISSSKRKRKYMCEALLTRAVQHNSVQSHAYKKKMRTTIEQTCLPGIVHIDLFQSEKPMTMTFLIESFGDEMPSIDMSCELYSFTHIWHWHFSWLRLFSSACIQSNDDDHLAIACAQTDSSQAQIQICHNNNNKNQNKSELNEEKDSREKKARTN